MLTKEDDQAVSRAVHTLIRRAASEESAITAMQLAQAAQNAAQALHTLNSISWKNPPAQQ